MSKLFTRLPGSVILSMTLVLATRAVATDAPETRIIQNHRAASSKQFASPLRLLAQSTQEINTPSQRSEVLASSDVKPTDSTAQSVPSPVERYGCMSGYGDSEALLGSADRTFQGDRPVSRYEFAAALNACLNQVNQLINANTADRVTQEDLAVPKRQLETLKLELDRLRIQLDGLDGENKQQ